MHDQPARIAPARAARAVGVIAGEARDELVAAIELVHRFGEQAVPPQDRKACVERICDLLVAGSRPKRKWRWVAFRPQPVVALQAQVLEGLGVGFR